MEAPNTCFHLHRVKCSLEENHRAIHTTCGKEKYKSCVINIGIEFSSISTGFGITLRCPHDRTVLGLTLPQVHPLQNLNIQQTQQAFESFQFSVRKNG